LKLIRESERENNEARAVTRNIFAGNGKETTAVEEGREEEEK